MFLYKNLAYCFPNAAPLFPDIEYPNQLLGTSLNSNHAFNSLFDKPSHAFDIRNENTLLFLHVAFYIPLFAIEYQHWINEQWNVTNKRYINSTIMLHYRRINSIIF